MSVVINQITGHDGAKYAAFGWMKTVAGLRKTRFKGRVRVAAQVVFAAAAYNLTRMMTLLGWRAPELSTT